MKTTQACEIVPPWTLHSIPGLAGLASHCWWRWAQRCSLLFPGGLLNRWSALLFGPPLLWDTSLFLSASRFCCGRLAGRFFAHSSCHMSASAVFAPFASGGSWRKQPCAREQDSTDSFLVPPVRACANFHLQRDLQLINVLHLVANQAAHFFQFFVRDFEHQFVMNLQ